MALVDSGRKRQIATDGDQLHVDRTGSNYQTRSIGGEVKDTGSSGTSSRPCTDQTGLNQTTRPESTQRLQQPHPNRTPRIHSGGQGIHTRADPREGGHKGKGGREQWADPLSPRTMTLRRVRLRDVDMAARWRSRSAPLALALLSSSSREAHEEFGGSGREIQRSTRRCWRWSDGFDFLLAFLLERLARRRAVTCSQ